MEPEQSTARLWTVGIDVLRSSCGMRTGVGFAAVCGGVTGQIIVRDISAAELSAAEELGYRSVGLLVDAEAGTSYREVDCAN